MIRSAGAWFRNATRFNHSSLAGRLATAMHIQRLVTVYDVDVQALPQDLQVLTDEDRKAVEDGERYFKGLAKRAKAPWLREILKRCAKARGGPIEFHAEGNDPFVPYFRFSWGGGPALCLPRGPLPSGLPDVLKNFYSLIGGFQENEFGCAGGVRRADELQTIAETKIWVSDENVVVDPEEAVVFLETFSGSQLCYLPDGRGAWLRAGDFEIVEDLEAEVAKYFDALLKEERI